jgi:hypothetical protein
MLHNVMFEKKNTSVKQIQKTILVDKIVRPKKKLHLQRELPKQEQIDPSPVLEAVSPRWMMTGIKAGYGSET